MAECVILKRMAGRVDGGSKFGVVSYASPDAKKSRLGIIPGEYIEHFESVFRRGPIIDRQPDLPVFRYKTRNHLTVQRTVP